MGEVTALCSDGI